MEPAQAITDVLGMVGQRVDKSNAQAAAKLEELSQQIAAAAAQIAALPTKEEEAEPAAEGPTSWSGSQPQRVRRQINEDGDGDAEMFDAEKFAAEAAA